MSRIVLRRVARRVRFTSGPGRPAGLTVVVVAAVVVSAVATSTGTWHALAQTAAPRVELLNPDSTTSGEISAKSDGETTTYHLVAWVADAPADTIVQFKYQPEEGAEVGIVCADTGSTNAAPATADTYECQWSLAGVEDGGGSVRAELYAGGAEVAQDAEDVTVESTGQTVEIVRPRQGDPLTFQTASDGTVSTTIDFKTSAAGTPDGDEGTQRVVAYYSTARPGTEPAFVECGSKDTTGGTQDTVSCTMEDDDPATADRENDPSRVTAVAATAGDTIEGTPEPGVCEEPGIPLCDQQDVDSADAHRIADPVDASPTPTPTTTATQTPTQSPSSTGPGGDRTVSFAADRTRIVAGGRITFSGRISSGNAECSDGQEFVRIRRRIHGTDRYRNIAGLNTNDQGAFTLITRQKRSADYAALAPAHDDCHRAGSSPVSVLAKVKMQIAVSDATPQRGRLIEIKSSIRPQHDRTRLVLQRKKGGRWIRFMATELNRRSIGGFVFQADFRSRAFRTRWSARTSNNASNASRALRVRTH